MFEGRLLGLEHKYISQQHNPKCSLVAYSERSQVLADHVALKKVWRKTVGRPKFSVDFLQIMRERGGVQK